MIVVLLMRVNKVIVEWFMGLLVWVVAAVGV
jgi:hypothetical protein